MYEEIAKTLVFGQIKDPGVVRLIADEIARIVDDPLTAQIVRDRNAVNAAMTLGDCDLALKLANNSLPTYLEAVAKTSNTRFLHAAINIYEGFDQLT